jgi:uncharacterized protein YggE
MRSSGLSWAWFLVLLPYRLFSLLKRLNKVLFVVHRLPSLSGSNVMARLICLFLSVIVFSGTSYAGLEIPHVTVYGRAEAGIVPDVLTWRVSLKTVGGNVGDVSLAHAAEVDAVLDAISGLGTKREEIQTSYMQFRENWVYRNNSRLKDGYMASTKVTFTVTDFTLYVEYWTTLSELKNLTVDSVVFGLKNRFEVEDRLRLDAVRDARGKAIALGAALDVAVLEPLIIEELDGFAGSPAPVRMMEAAGARDSVQPVSPGKEIVAGRVKVVFRIGTP